MYLSQQSQQLTKCGQIYVNPKDVNFFVIDCLYCSDEFCDWPEYINHMQGDHIQKQRKFSESNTVHNEVMEDDSQNEFLEDNTAEDLIEVSEDEQNDNSELLLDYEDLLAIEMLENDSQDEIVDLKINTLDELNDDELEEYLIEPVEDNEEKNNEIWPANMDISKSIQIKAQNSTNPNKPKNSCFFRLTTTDSKTMFKFFELLRHHPCQWDHEHPDYDQKDKRAISSLELSKELNLHLNLNITPQGTRNSVLTLKRWFDQEYLRFLTCESKDLQFICMHSDYFEASQQTKRSVFVPFTPMTCNECNKHFKSEHLLLAHKHKHHNGETIPFQCRYCGRGFIHQSLHKMHENRHIKVQLWSCDSCLYQATSKADLVKHLETTHSSSRPYKCDVCGLVYKTSSNLNVHKKIHGLPEFVCELCNREFYEKYRYKRHLWLHGQRIDVIKVREDRIKIAIDNFTCQICGRRFSSNQNLMKHKLVHKEENYELDNVATTASTNLEKNVIARDDYCGYCYLAFINKEAYKTHMNVKHNIKK